MFLSLLLLIDISRAFILQTASLVGFFFVFFFIFTTARSFRIQSPSRG